MKSKEALQALKVFMKNFTGDFEKEYTPMDFEKSFFKTKFETIQKDLEVLEILKKHFQVYFDDETENGLEEKVFNGIDLDDIWGDGYDEDFDKIKEWLENE